jgi:citronellol/citronellal dehydrogenase
VAKLAGRVAVVTGASRGIGKAVAKLFAQEGALVVVTARSETENERLPGTIHRTVDEIQSDGCQALAIRCDIRHEDEVEAMARQAVEAFGSVDVLINNAAATFPAPAKDFPLKRWDIIMDVNVRGTFLCIRSVLPGMLERGGGSIVNITSGAGVMEARLHQGRLPSLGYGVSKAAVNKLTINLAKELEADGVAVNALMPKTAVATEGALAFFGGKVDPSFTGPENMAQASLHLALQTPAGLTGWVGYDEDLRAETGAW